MGIYERDYNKAPRNVPVGQTGVGMWLTNWRSWSVTTWLIIINVAVFCVNNIALESTVRYMPHGLDKKITEVSRDVWASRKAVTQREKLPNGKLVVWLGPKVADQKSTQEVGSPQGRIGYREMMPVPVVNSFGHFSTSGFWNKGQVWRVLTFQFLHGNFTHLAFNMIGLIMFGRLVEGWFRSKRRYLAFYLLSGCAGALLFMTLNILTLTTGWKFPGALAVDPTTPLVGASAGVFGVLMGAAFVAPSMTILVMMILPMRIVTAAYIFFALAVLNLLSGGGNAGGDAAHVGGALAGFWLIRNPHVVGNFVEPFEFAVSWIPGMKRVLRPRNPKGPAEARFGQNRTTKALKGPSQSEVDRILDKVSDKGLQSLTTKEKKTLKEASDMQGPYA